MPAERRRPAHRTGGAAVTVAAGRAGRLSLRCGAGRQAPALDTAARLS